MSLIPRHGSSIIIASFVVALMLTMLPLPEWAHVARPEWVALTLIYWCMALPHRIGVGIGWSLGLLLDVIRGTVLGQHALVLALIAYLTLQLYQRIRLYPLSQQALVVMMLVVMGQMLSLWIRGLLGEPPQTWAYWLPSLTSPLLWPWVYLVLREVRRYFVVN